MSTTNDGEGNVGQATAKPKAEKPAETEGTAAAVEEALAPDANAEVALLREELDAMRAQMAEVVQSATAAIEAAKVQAAATPSDAGLVASAVASLEARMAEQGRKSEEGVPRAEDREEGFEPVKFRAKGVNFSIVRVPRHRWTAGNGEMQITEGRRYDFAPAGVLDVYNSDVAEWLRSRGSFNMEFWEVGNEPHAAPDPAVELKRIMQAVADLNDAALQEIFEREAGSHKRKTVLEAAVEGRRIVQQAGGSSPEGGE